MTLVWGVKSCIGSQKLRQQKQKYTHGIASNKKNKPKQNKTKKTLIYSTGNNQQTTHKL
jgi:hypothetical protein